MQRDRTAVQRNAACRQRRRAGLVTLALDLPADALTATLQASGAIEPGTQPSREQLAQYATMLPLTQISDVQRGPCRVNPAAGVACARSSAHGLTVKGLT
jgi:hypothetical protein